jgi:PilZ domain
VTTPPKEVGLQRVALAVPDEARVAIHDAYSCPETLLFLANELVNQPAVEARSSERLLYGAAVRFRTAGRDNTDIGYLFNISGGGVYVRTLAAPAQHAELWLEFTPPRCDRLVHLEGTAVWARGFGPGSGATVPAGFGLQITGASDADRIRYLQSYETFRDERQAAPVTMNCSLSPIAARSSLTAPAAHRKKPAAPAIYIVPSGSSR